MGQLEQIVERVANVACGLSSTDWRCQRDVRFSNRPRSRSSAFRPSTTTVSTSLTGSRFGFGTKALVWGFLVKRFKQGRRIFFVVSFDGDCL